MSDLMPQPPEARPPSTPSPSTPSPRNRAFNAVLATRLTLLLALGLTTGLSAAMYLPLNHTAALQAPAQSAATQDAAPQGSAWDQGAGWDTTDTQQAAPQDSQDSGWPQMSTAPQGPVTGQTRAS